jgi:hypothetical protein
MIKQIPIVNHNKQIVSGDCTFLVEHIGMLVKKYRQKREDSDITQQIAYCIVIDDLIALLSDFSHR